MLMATVFGCLLLVVYCLFFGKCFVPESYFDMF